MQLSFGQAKPGEDPRLRRDRVVGLGIVAAAFVVALAISLWAKVQSRPETSAPPGPPTTEGVVGWPERVDPVRTLAAARELTKRTLLRGIVMNGVTSDGRVDLTEGPGNVQYIFQSAPGEGPQPTPDPSPRLRRTFCGLQRVQLRKEGLVAEPDNAVYACRVSQPDALPDPRCGPKEVWQHALTRGAQRDQPAHIEYYRAKAGPAWRFSAGVIQFSLYGDCGRELSLAESTGTVP
jgi:hypothetical protein